MTSPAASPHTPTVQQELLRVCKLWRDYMHHNFSPDEIWFWVDTENAIDRAEAENR
jgi:hypothetical protein